MPVEEQFFGAQGRHDSYAWAMDLFDLNGHLPFPNASAVRAAFPKLQTIEPATTVRVAERGVGSKLAMADDCMALLAKEDDGAKTFLTRTTTRTHHCQGDYNARVASTKDKCNVIIHVGMDVRGPEWGRALPTPKIRN